MEGEAAGRVIDLATLVGTPLYVFHVSCSQVVARIAAARRQNLPVYGETCPQYLFLTDALYDRPGVEGALPVCSPPLRSESDQSDLWEALAHNQLQVVSTDHCPFTRTDKAEGLGDFSAIPGGVPSIEARFPLIYASGVKTGRFSASRWVDMCCTTPARLFGLTQKGVIAPGYDADLVIFDPEAQVTLSTATLHENVDWTPYDGLSVTGWPAVTISRGEIIAENGSFLGKAGRGQFLARRPSA
jgi:dihydropyrimidinase